MRASDGREVSGFYDVIKTNSPNADEVQVTLRMRLTNLSETSLTITQLELPSFLPAPKTTKAISPAVTTMDLFLTVHDSKTIERQFTVSRTEYEHWKTGGYPRLLVTMDTSASQHVSRIVPLFLMKGIKE
jgi:hypothetical protein